MRTVLARVALAALSLCLALALAACGDDDDDGDSAKAEQFTVTETQEGKGKWKLNAPKSVKAGLVEISFEAPAGKGSHSAQLVRVEGDHSEADVLKAVSGGEGAPIPGWLRGGGGVGETKAGETGAATQVLEPGKYVVFDDSETEGEGEDLPTYAEQGAITSFEVTGDAQTADLPEADAKVTADEYTFTTDGLKAGKNTIEFENTGKELHHVIAFPYAKGATLDEVKKAFASERPPKGPPPVDFDNGSATAVLDGGKKQVTELDLKSGKYAFICFVPDRKGGPPHIAKGMIKEVNVE